MKKILALLALFAPALGTLALPSFEPFANATNSGGSAYAVGAPLSGQTNAGGGVWYGINTSVSSGPVVLTNANLKMPAGMPASSGNAALLVNVIGGPGGRFNVGNFPAGTAATVFYSAVIQLLDITSLAAATANGGGAFNMGFNNTTGTAAGQSSLPSDFHALLYMGKSGSGYVLGTGRSTGASSRFWEAAPGTESHHTGDVVFVVLEYEIVPGITNDVARLWVNPDPSTFGVAAPPPPTVVADDTGVTAETDISPLNSFILVNRNTGLPNVMIVDELRFGTNWADVTPAMPTLSISVVNPSTVQLTWTTNFTGYTLQGVNQLLNSGTAWSPVSGTPAAVGTQFTQTDTLNKTNFYRLIK